MVLIPPPEIDPAKVVDTLREGTVVGPAAVAADLSPFRQLIVNLDTPAWPEPDASSDTAAAESSSRVPAAADSFHVQHGVALRDALRVTLKRTIRVPDNADSSALPPDMGPFPLFRVRDYAHRLPADMAAKGGLFFPMYQREAMWISFYASVPFAVKVYVGGVNAVSGYPMVDWTDKTATKREKMLKAAKEALDRTGKPPQDYMVLPQQPWLDGIVSEDGRIRQFVAKAKGSGFAVEAQVSGSKEEKVGGIQIEIIPAVKVPPKRMGFRFTDRDGDDQPDEGKPPMTLNLETHGLSETSTWGDVKRVVGGLFDVPDPEKNLALAIDSDEVPLPYADASKGFLSPEMGLDDNARMLGDIVWPYLADAGRDPIVITARDTRPSLKPQPQPQSFSQFRMGDYDDGPVGLFAAAAPMAFSMMSSTIADDSMDFEMEEGGANLDEFDFDSFVARDLEATVAGDERAPLPPPASPPTPSISAAAAPIGMPSAEKLAAAPAPPPQSSKKARKKTAAPPPQVQQLSMAAGGMIVQSIERDVYPASAWDPEASVLLNLQILEVPSFCAVTGRPPPDTPVDAKTYAEHGYPFFELEGEAATGVAGDFGDVKSVAQLEREQAEERGEAVPEEETVRPRVVTIGAGCWNKKSADYKIGWQGGLFSSSFKPLEELEKELEKLSLEGGGGKDAAK